MIHHMDIGAEVTVHWKENESTICVSHDPGVDPLKVTQQALKEAEARVDRLRLVELRLLEALAGGEDSK